jgi:hypothetical protein
MIDDRKRNPGSGKNSRPPSAALLQRRDGLHYTRVTLEYRTPSGAKFIRVATDDKRVVWINSDKRGRDKVKRSSNLGCKLTTLTGAARLTRIGTSPTLTSAVLILINGRIFVDHFLRRSVGF